MRAVRTDVREPAVAGSFYPDDPRALRDLVQRCVPSGARPGPAIAVVSPHAGYEYSGRVAGATLARVTVPRGVVLLGPNHTGLGRPYSLMVRGRWQTPLGGVPVDEELADALRQHCQDLEPDEEAHRMEHSLEVQIPFLQTLQPDLRIVPIILTSARMEIFRRIGEGLAAAIKSWREPVLLVASSDMTHYEPHETAKAKDAKAIEAILALDAERLLRTVHEQDISMCGYAPTVAMLVAARALGAATAELVDYRTSGDTTGDFDAVVGYAGIVIR